MIRRPGSHQILVLCTASNVNVFLKAAEIHICENVCGAMLFRSPRGSRHGDIPCLYAAR